MRVKNWHPWLHSWRSGRLRVERIAPASGNNGCCVIKHTSLTLPHCTARGPLPLFLLMLDTLIWLSFPTVFSSEAVWCIIHGKRNTAQHDINAAEGQWKATVAGMHLVGLAGIDIECSAAPYWPVSIVSSINCCQQWGNYDLDLSISNIS